MLLTPQQSGNNSSKKAALRNERTSTGGFNLLDTPAAGNDALGIESEAIEDTITGWEAFPQQLQNPQQQVQQFSKQSLRSAAE